MGKDTSIRQRYLYLPVRNGAPKRLARVLVDGVVVTEFEIEWAEESPDFSGVLRSRALSGAGAGCRAGWEQGVVRGYRLWR